MAKKQLPNSVYPYGVYEFPKEFRELSVVKEYTRRHPFISTPYPVKDEPLQRIAGSFEIQKSLPDWWNSMLQEIKGNLQFLFMGITAQEYHSGQLDERRYKIYRAMVGEEEKKLIPQSPKLGGILEAAKVSERFKNAFNSRGEKSSKATAYITWKPDEMFFMSNGSGWTSCQHYSRGGYEGHLRSGMFDRSRGMAYILAEGFDHIYQENSVIARVLLQSGTMTSTPHKPAILVDRSYGNDNALQAGLIDGLKGYIEGKGIDFCTTRRNTSFTTFVQRSFINNPFYIPANWSEPYQDSLTSLMVEPVTYKEMYYTMYRHHATSYAPENTSTFGAEIEVEESEN